MGVIKATFPLVTLEKSQGAGNGAPMGANLITSRRRQKCVVIFITGSELMFALIAGAILTKQILHYKEICTKNGLSRGKQIGMCVRKVAH